MDLEKNNKNIHKIVIVTILTKMTNNNNNNWAIHGRHTLYGRHIYDSYIIILPILYYT